MWPTNKVHFAETRPSPRVLKTREKSKRPQLSCNACRARKVKCDRVQPCTACSLHQIAGSCKYDLTEAERKPILQAEALREKDREIARLKQQVDALGGTSDSGAAGSLARKKRRRVPAPRRHDIQRALPPIVDFKPGPSAGTCALPHRALSVLETRPGVDMAPGSISFMAPISPDRKSLPTPIHSYASRRPMGAIVETWETELKKAFPEVEQPLCSSLKLPSGDIQSTLDGGSALSYRPAEFSHEPPSNTYTRPDCPHMFSNDSVSTPVSCSLRYPQSVSRCAASSSSAPAYAPSLYHASSGSSSYAQSTTSSLHTPSASHPVSPTLSQNQAYCISRPQTQPQSPVWTLDNTSHCIAESAMAVVEKDYHREDPWEWKLSWAG